MRKSKVYIRSLFNLVTIVTLIVLVLVGVSYFVWKNELRQEMTYHFNVNHVEKHRSSVEKHAKEAGLEAEVETLLAIMMQESGGRGQDPMQASESLCGEVGCITEPEKSIEQGVSYYKQTLEAAKGDRKLAVQSYNFGVGFIDYALTHEGKYTPEIAIKFSQEMYNRAEDQSIYTCKRKEAKEYDACYGDILYVRNVLGYRDIFIANTERELASTQQ